MLSAPRPRTLQDGSGRMTIDVRTAISVNRIRALNTSARFVQ
jgi:hypothetical protein